MFAKFGGGMRRLFRLPGKRGFTLVEVLLVITVVAILASLALLQFRNYHQKSVNSVALSDLKNLEAELQAYYSEFKEYP